MTDIRNLTATEVRAQGAAGASTAVRSPEQPSISLAISDLEREASSLRTTNKQHVETITALHQQEINLRGSLGIASTERDSYMRLSAELKTLLDSAATLILEGLKRAREGTDRVDTLETIVQPDTSKAQP